MAEHCGHQWTVSRTVAGWEAHSCVRPTGHAGDHRCGCNATTPKEATSRG